ncbi:MAG: RHS repeat domain-containing protein [Acutalibacteraceae bacterium]
MKKLKKSLIILLSVMMMFGVLAPTQAFAGDVRLSLYYDVLFEPKYNAADFKTSYVCTKEVTKSEDGTETTTYTYNSSGRVTKKTYTLGSGLSKLTETTTYTYDDKGNVTKERQSSKIGIIPAGISTTVRTYDSKNRITKESITSDAVGLNKDVTEYKYNSKGQLTSKVNTVYDMGQKSVESSTYTYDKSGRLIKFVYFDSELDMTCTTAYTYDKNGNVSKTVYEREAEDDTAKITSRYTYDKKGNILTEKTTSVYPDFTDTTYVTNTYDKNYNLIKSVEKSTDSDGYKKTTTTTNAYDKKGRLIKSETRSNSGGETSRVSSEAYTYDKNGNCIKSVCSDDMFGEKMIVTETKTFDKNNRITKIACSIKLGPNSLSVNYTYTFAYDKHGNLIKTTDEHLDSKSTTTYTYQKLDRSVVVIDDSIRMDGYSYTYDGKPKTPNITIDGMQPGLDYTVTYKNNVKAGTAKAIITFSEDNKELVRDGSGVITIYYKINKAK